MFHVSHCTYSEQSSGSPISYLLGHRNERELSSLPLPNPGGGAVEGCAAACPLMAGEETEEEAVEKEEAVPEYQIIISFYLF